MESFKEIQDSVCVSQRSKDGVDERVILFLKMAPGSEFGSTVVDSIKHHIRTYLSARHVPALILPIDDIPVSTTYTCNIFDSFKKNVVSEIFISLVDEVNFFSWRKCY